jgi:hypothetical protein
MVNIFFINKLQMIPLSLSLKFASRINHDFMTALVSVISSSSLLDVNVADSDPNDCLSVFEVAAEGYDDLPIP